MDFTPVARELEAAHLRQAGRHISIIIKNGLAMLMLNLRRHAHQMIERRGQNQHGVNVALLISIPFWILVGILVRALLLR